MKTYIIIAIVLATGGGALLMRQTGGDGGGRKYKDDVLHVVTRGKLTVTVTENGTLMAKNSEKINFMGRRQAKITSLIEEGKTVETGEVLCQLETTELETQLQDLKLNIVQTEADLDTAKTELEIQISENAADVEKARIALTKAEKELEKYRDGDAPKERRNLEIAIKEAETRWTKAKKKYEDSVKLLEQNYINKSQVEEDQIDFERAEIQKDGAYRDLELYETYTYPLTMTDRETSLSDAERALANAEKRAKSKQRQCEVSVESKDQRLKTLRKNQQELEDDIEKCTMKSPLPGIVLYGDPSEPWYRDNIQLGKQIWGGFTLFTIPDLRVMQVQVQVHEADINKLKEEQPATITMDTYPGLTLRGRITKIAAIASEQNWRRWDDVKKFTVDITLDTNEDLNLKPGISAKAEIFVEEKADVLAVPLQCVFIEEGSHYSYVLAAEDDKPRRTEVKVGISNDSHIEMLEGLSEGDRVLLFNPVLAEQAQKAATTANGTAPTTQNATP